MQVAATEEGKQEERRRRTEGQRERRQRERICGNCREHADGGLLEWSGRGEPLRIPVCRRCRDRLEGQLPRWGEVQSNGVWCPVQTARPCADCLSEPAPHRTQRGLFRRLLGG